MLRYNQSKTCMGYVHDGKADINYSSIMSELVKAAGTLCEDFASDVYYDLQLLEIWKDALRSELTFIGIRNSGVDGYDFVKCRLEKLTEIIDDQYILDIYNSGNNKDKLLDNILLDESGWHLHEV